MKKINGNDYGTGVYFEAAHYADTGMTCKEVFDDAVECGYNPDRASEIARCAMDIKAERKEKMN